MIIKEMSATLVPQGVGYDEMLKHIELCGRVCYKSEGRITEDSHKDFVAKIKKLHHLSVLEHGTVYLHINTFYDKATVSKKEQLAKESLYSFFSGNRFSTINIIDTFHCYITTNYRVLVENNLLEECRPYMMSEPTENHEKRYTFKIEAPIAVTREGNRHRNLSVSEKSTRYVKEKNGITIAYTTFLQSMATPDVVDGMNALYCSNKAILDAKIGLDCIVYLSNLKSAETTYMRLIENNVLAQFARGVLPLDTLSEVYWTMTGKDWEHFLELRTSDAAHPDIRFIATEIKKQLDKVK